MAAKRRDDGGIGARFGERGELALQATHVTDGGKRFELGEIGGVPVYISGSQFAVWQHTQLILDVIDGHGGTFSLEGSTGKAFHTRSRVFTDEELAHLPPAIPGDQL